MTWRKSTYSTTNGGACVEVACPAAPAIIAVRDSQDPRGPHLLFTPADWQQFLRHIKAST